MRGFVIIFRLKKTHKSIYFYQRISYVKQKNNNKKQQKTQRQVGFINQSGPMN